MARNEAMASARAIVRELDRVALASGGGLLAPAPHPLSLPRALTSSLVQILSSALEGQSIEQNSNWRAKAFRAREITRQIPFRVRSAAPRERALVFVPRTNAHLRDMLPVANSFTQREAGWAVFRSDQAKTLTGTGHDVYAVHAHSLRASLASGELRKGISSLLRAASDQSPSIARWGELIAKHLRENAALAAHSASSLRAYFERVRPKVVVIGNPALMEGRVAGHLAREIGARTLTIQHGDILEGKDVVEGYDVDAFCVWGERSRDMLIRSGIEASRIHVTGAAWLEPRSTAPKPRAQRTTVLVALSGAGHMVGRTEHERAVGALFNAARELRDVKFVFRVHPKDDPAPYRARASALDLSRVQVVAARETSVTMQEQLRESDVLVTIMSTSALDAMLAGVPVLTLNRPAGEHVPDYVQDGATTQADPDESLVASLRVLVDRGEPSWISERATSFASKFYGPLDGHAADRIAAVIRTAIDASS